MQTEKFSDDELINGFNEGHSECFEHIFNRYWEIMFRQAFHMLRNEDTAKDVVQDVFQSILEKGFINPDMKLAAFLYTATKNRIINIFRKDTVRRKFLAFMVVEHNHRKDGHNNSTEDNSIAKEIEREISIRANRLPKKERQSLSLRVDRDLSYKEIAQKMGSAIGTVRKQIHDARKKLKKELREQFPHISDLFK